MIIAKKRINSVDFIEEFESKEFLIGIKVTNNELAKQILNHLMKA